MPNSAQLNSVFVTGHDRLIITWKHVLLSKMCVCVKKVWKMSLDLRQKLRWMSGSQIETGS